MSSTRAIELPDPVTAGAPVLAKDFNAVVDALRKILNVKGGNGVLVRFTADGVVIELAAAQGEQMLPAKITAVSVSGAGPFDAATVNYSAQAIGRPDVAPITAAIPKYGRPVKGNEVAIWPCAVGDPCWIVRRPNGGGSGAGMTASLMVSTEYIAFSDCPAS